MSELPQQNMNVVSSVGGPLFVGFLGLVALFGGGGLWMGMVNISGAVIANGSIAVVGKPKTIQHLDGGVVEKIHVTDEAIVKRGDVLIQLDDSLLKANIEIYSHRLQETLANKARLEAENAELDKISWENAKIVSLNITLDERMRLIQEKIFKVRRSTMLGRVKQMKEKIKQYKNQIIGVSGLMQSKSRQIALLNKEWKPSRKLYKKGYSTQTKILALERQIIDLRGQISEHTAELARIENSINETKIQTLQVLNDYREKALTELQKMNQEMSDMVQQLVTTKEKLKRITIRSPVNGMVHQLSVFTIGGVITPGAAIMQIVPQNSQIEIEARVEPQFIDEIHLHQEARLLFSAFNQKTTPQVNGNIKSISPSSIIDEKTGMAYYTIRIFVSKEELDRLGNKHLLPGMPVETFIKTKDRTPLTYLTKPLMDQINRAFREE